MWESQSYEVLNLGDVREQVHGIVSRGLGVHLNHRFHHIAVTHLQSGKRLASFSAVGAACTFINRIAGLRDWTVPLKDGRLDASLARQVRKAAQEVERE